MASLRYSQIRAHPGGTIHYIANVKKMLSPRACDIHNVLCYMGEPESVERVYSLSHHCSTNPDLASAQMELYRAQYYESNSGGVQGLKEGASELLGLHFFLSYTEEDDPDIDAMNTITAELMSYPLFRRHATFAANHFDKTHKHSHIFVCQYSAEGKPRKFCMRHKDFDNLRKYINHLCVEHGLSIIDLPSLRYNDPEYSAWIDGVIAEGKITIHPESEAHKGAHHQKASTRQVYYKHMKNAEEYNQQEEARLTAAQLRRKQVAAKYFWTFDGKPRKPSYPISGDPKKRYHAVKRFDTNGRERSLIELICMLVITIYRSEMSKHAQAPGITGQVIQSRTDQNVQAMMDSLRISREMHINTPEDITTRLADTGRQMNGLKAEIRRLEESLQDSQNREGESLEQLHARHQFQRKKLSDYEKRMANLRRQYRGLKKLQALATHADRIAEQVYLCKPNVSLEDYIKVVEQKNRIASKDLPKTKHEKLFKED